MMRPRLAMAVVGAGAHVVSSSRISSQIPKEGRGRGKQRGGERGLVVGEDVDMRKKTEETKRESQWRCGSSLY